MATAKKHGIARQIQELIKAIDSLSMTLAMSFESLSRHHTAAHEEYDAFVEKYAVTTERDGKRYMRIRSHEYCHDYGLLRRQLDRLHAASDVVPKSFLVALVSQYDAFLGALFRELVLLKPELLRASGCTLTFSQLAEFSSIDAARDFVLEREIEALLRKSHTDQFKYLEEKYDIELHKDLPEWPIFVELTERRNLFVHADGYVSNQYIANCRQHGVHLDDGIKPGVRLTVNPEYFRLAYTTIYELAVKLSQVLWRKVAPNEAEGADDSLADITFDLLCDSRYEVAKILLNFADTTLKKRHANERFRLMFLVNRALIHYLTGDKQECVRILEVQDWSAASDPYKLAHAVLLEEYDEAAAIMRRIGNSQYPHKGDYLHWPLFEDFRKTAQFSDAFRQVFGDETHDESVPTGEPPEKGPTVQ